MPIVAQHHEWFNGKGYPEGLAGEDISLHARVFAIADCYDALTSDRPYRKGLTPERTIAILAVAAEGAGRGSAMKTFRVTAILVVLLACAGCDKNTSPMLPAQLDGVWTSDDPVTGTDFWSSGPHF